VGFRAVKVFKAIPEDLHRQSFREPSGQPVVNTKRLASLTGKNA